MNTIKNTVATRVKQLQKWMEEERLDAFIVPTIDPHNSEYTPDHWKAREWLTGFDGSGVVFRHDAWIFLSQFAHQVIGQFLCHDFAVATDVAYL